MADLLQELHERVKSVGGEWAQYSVIGSFLLYTLGYLALRFHLTALGIGTDLAVLDERYLFTGARFVVYLVSSIPIILLIALPVAAMLWALSRVVPPTARAKVQAWLGKPARLVVIGIVCAVIMIQFVMRQCFVFSNLLLTDRLPPGPTWLVNLLLDDRQMALYFSALVAACGVSVAILVAVRRASTEADRPVPRRLLAFLAGVQLLLLPINYGILIVDKTLPRVASVGETSLAGGDEAWLVWEGKDGVTFLVRNREPPRRALLTLGRGDVHRIEIIGFDPILPILFKDR